MIGFHLSIFCALLGSLAFGCSSSSTPAGNTAQPGVTGTAFGQAFTARDTLLVHPVNWKSADAGSTAILLSDTPNLCKQITSSTTTAPGRLVIVSLEKTGADGAVVDLGPGQFVAQGQGTPSSSYGEVFVSGVDVQCRFDKLFSDQSSIQVTAVGPQSNPVTVSIDVHFTSGDSLHGIVSAATGCDEALRDKYLNGSWKCG